MKIFSVVLVSAVSLSAASPEPAPLDRVEITDGFWSDWLQRNRRVTLPHIFRMIEATGVRSAFLKAAGKLEGDFQGFHNSDEIFYKAVEALAYEQARRPDPELAALLERSVEEIAAAQEPDGYTCTPATIRRRRGAVHPRFSGERPLAHELYLFGHLYDAAVAHYLATGRLWRYSVEKGYAVLNRRWRAGDEIALQLPMPVRRLVSHPSVRENAGRVALQRGALVYCLEGADHQGSVYDIVLPRQSRFRPENRPNFLGGVVVLTGTAKRRDGSSVRITAIPYYAWSNRGAGQMRVWLPEAP